MSLIISNIVVHLFCPHYLSLLFPIMDIEDACLIIKPLPLFQGWSQPVSVLKQKKNVWKESLSNQIACGFLRTRLAVQGEGKERRYRWGSTIAVGSTLLSLQVSYRTQHLDNGIVQLRTEKVVNNLGWRYGYNQCAFSS